MLHWEPAWHIFLILRSRRRGAHWAVYFLFTMGRSPVEARSTALEKMPSQKRISDFFGQPKPKRRNFNNNIIDDDDLREGEAQLSQENSRQSSSPPPATPTSAAAVNTTGDREDLPSAPAVSDRAPGNSSPALSDIDEISDDDEPANNVDTVSAAKAAIEGPNATNLTAFEEPFQPHNFDFPGRRFGTEIFQTGLV